MKCVCQRWSRSAMQCACVKRWALFGQHVVGDVCQDQVTFWKVYWCQDHVIVVWLLAIMAELKTRHRTLTDFLFISWLHLWLCNDIMNWYAYIWLSIDKWGCNRVAFIHFRYFLSHWLPGGRSVSSSSLSFSSRGSEFCSGYSFLFRIMWQYVTWSHTGYSCWSQCSCTPTPYPNSCILVGLFLPSLPIRGRYE